MTQRHTKAQPLRSMRGCKRTCCVCVHMRVSLCDRIAVLQARGTLGRKSSIVHALACEEVLLGIA